MFRTTIALLVIASVCTVQAMQAGEIEALSQIQSQLPQLWRYVDFSLHVKDVLIQSMTEKSANIQRLREESNGPLNEIQKFEHEFVEAMQSGAAQNEIDARFKALSEIQQKYDEQLREASRLIQINTVESEIAEDILLRNYALESCLLRRDLLASKLKLGETVTYKDLEAEKRSLVLSEEEQKADKLLEGVTGEPIVNQLENLCGKRADILFQSVQTVVTEYNRQQDFLRQQKIQEEIQRNNQGAEQPEPAILPAYQIEAHTE